MKSIRLSRHARRRMDLYGITLEQITRTLAEPEYLVPSVKGRYNAYRKMGGRFLRVTYAEDDSHCVVVSVTPRKRFEGVI